MLTELPGKEKGATMALPLSTIYMYNNPVIDHRLLLFHPGSLGVLFSVPMAVMGKDLIKLPSFNDVRTVILSYEQHQ